MTTAAAVAALPLLIGALLIDAPSVDHVPTGIPLVFNGALRLSGSSALLSTFPSPPYLHCSTWIKTKQADNRIRWGRRGAGGGTPNGDETIRTRKGLKTDNSTHTQTHTHTRNHRKQQQKQRGSQSAPRCPWRDGLIPDCQSIKTLRGGWEREGRRGGGISICRDLWWRQTVSRVAVVQGVDQVSVWRRSAGGCHQFGEWVIGRAASGHAEDVGELGGAQRLQHTVEQLLDVQLAAALAQTIAYRFVKVGRIPVDDWSRLSKLRSSNSHRVEFICHLIRSKIDLIYVT